jgi:hypothetical protein
MKNKVVEGYEAEDLRLQVRKVLRGLGNPEPPLDLREVRELLALDRHFYNSKDDGALREVVSRVKIAGKQLALRPTLLFDVVRKASLSALWLPDRKRILIDQDLPPLKHRWAEAHEIGHSIAPWHARFLFGDSEEELKPSCHEKLENEANHVAGQLLFLQDRFSAEANDLPIALGSVLSLSKTFGNTLTSTLWRFVEETHPGLPMVGLVAKSPRNIQENTDLQEPRRYCIESPAFKKSFCCISEFELLNIIAGYCRPRRGGPLGDTETLLVDNNGEKHVFRFESFSNGYDTLTIGVYSRKVQLGLSLISCRT